MHGLAYVMLILGFNDMSRVIKNRIFAFANTKSRIKTVEQRTPIVNSLYFLNQSLLAISIGHTARVVSDLVGNPKAGFFRVVAQVICS